MPDTITSNSSDDARIGQPDLRDACERSHDAATAVAESPPERGRPQDTPDALGRVAARVTAGDPASPYRVPGLVIAVYREDDGAVFRHASGTDGAGRPWDVDTLYPIASASKLATGLAVLRLVDAGVLALDAPVERYLPEAAAGGATLRQLLSHTSGLPLEVAPETVALDPPPTWATVARACLATEQVTAPGTVVQYSNVGFGLLALAAERAAGQSFASLIRREVFAPLGIDAYFGDAPERPTARVAEVDSEYVGTSLEPYNSLYSRRLALPWLGVVCTVHALLTLVRAAGGRTSPALLSPSLAELATTDATHGLSGGFGSRDPFLFLRRSHSITWPVCPWGLSVEVRGDKRPHWTPPTADPRSYGLIGSSGCIAWYDPARRVAWAAFGGRTTDGGWLLRHGSAIGMAAYALAGARRATAG